MNHSRVFVRVCVCMCVCVDVGGCGRCVNVVYLCVPVCLLSAYLLICSSVLSVCECSCIACACLRGCGVACCLCVSGGMAGAVGASRYKHKIKAPATTGHPKFEACFRAQCVAISKRTHLSTRS